jgi:muconolactone delta-isomerase
VKFLVMSYPADVDTRAKFAEEEDRLIVQLHREGFIEQIFRRPDGQGAASLIEAPSAEVVERRLNELPYLIHGCITIEIWPVTPRF